MSKDITIRSSVEEFLIFKTQEKDEGICKRNFISNFQLSA